MSNVHYPTVRACNQEDAEENVAVINVDSQEASFHPSRETQISDLSLNSHVSRQESHVHTPRMVDYPLNAVFYILGLKWFNPHFTNSCNLDSWLTFLKILSMKHPKVITDSLRLYDDPAEEAVKEIVNAYHSGQINPGLMEAQDYAARSVWCENVMGWFHQPGTRKVDLLGDEHQNVWRHLEGSTLFQWNFKCCCSTQFLPARWIYLEDPQHAARLTRSFDPECSPRYNKRCERCRTPIFHSGLLPHDHTWILRFMVQPNPVPNFQFRSSELPNFITIGDIAFKLGYVTFSSPAKDGNRHQTSCHLIQDQWFHYDGLNFNGQLRKVADPNLPQPYTPENIIYYKWSDLTKRSVRN